MSYFYIASYPKSGNTWVRIFIKYLHLIKDCKGDFRNKNFHIDINNNLNTGEIYSSRSWIDEIIGIDSSDLSSIEISKLDLWREDHRFSKLAKRLSSIITSIEVNSEFNSE